MDNLPALFRALAVYFEENKGVTAEQLLKTRPAAARVKTPKPKRQNAQKVSKREINRSIHLAASKYIKRCK